MNTSESKTSDGLPQLNLDLENRFSYHKPKDGQTRKYERIRDIAKNYADYLTDNCPRSRELSLALTNLEQVVMWANASIARRE